MNALLVRAPEFHHSGVIGIVPFYSLFACCLGEEAAAYLFLDAEWNRQLKRILDRWTDFLSSEESRYVLNTDPHTGWLGEDAMTKMPNFTHEFVCVPEQPHWGYQSWDHFFTREFRLGARPVEFSTDESIIVNACESAPYRLADHVQQSDTFWLKGLPYSLQDMLGSDTVARHFVGGTVYQGLLSAFNYHRWHSPVNGRIKDAYVIDGANYWGALRSDLDYWKLLDSQASAAHLASRAVILIEADNPSIGLMCVLPVGMVDVSTCELTVQPGQRVRKGDQLGMFHYGGSTHCLLFRPGLELNFDLHGQTCGVKSSNIPLMTKIAQVQRE